MSEPIERDARLLKMARRPLGPAGRVAQAFINSKLTPLLVVAALILGVFAVLATPREEEPQILVPMIDVLVPYPGAIGARGGGAGGDADRAAGVGDPGRRVRLHDLESQLRHGDRALQGGSGSRGSARQAVHQDHGASGGSCPQAPGRRSSSRSRSTTCRSWPSPCGASATTASTLRKAAEEVALEIKKIPNISEVNDHRRRAARDPRRAWTRSGCAATAPARCRSPRPSSSPTGTCRSVRSPRTTAR